MTKRKNCEKCQKAEAACICSSIVEIDNLHFLHILQDPSEEKKAIGTARILLLSLLKSKLHIGKICKSDDLDLENTYLLYPDEQAIDASDLNASKQINNKTQFILLDGTWKKTYKLLQNNPFLQYLSKVSIKVNKPSNYRIRKSSKEQGLSSVEAGYYLLAQLEMNEKKYQPLLTSFQSMIDFQISKMPKNIYEQHFKGSC
ncbi:MAG TPA: DTW domain-containing protein [Psychromonas hadalis]|nr:DTW domain-containing protein [Psychromonas hadalis]